MHTSIPTHRHDSHEYVGGDAHHSGSPPAPRFKLPGILPMTSRRRAELTLWNPVQTRFWSPLDQLESETRKKWLSAMGGSAMAIDGETANSGALVAAPRNMLTCARLIFCASVADTGPRHPWACGLARIFAPHALRRARVPTAHENQREHAPERTPGQRTQTCARTHTHTHTHTHRRRLSGTSGSVTPRCCMTCSSTTT